MMIASALRLFAVNDLAGKISKRIDGAIIVAIVAQVITTVIMQNTMLVPIIDTTADQCAAKITKAFAYTTTLVPIALDIVIVIRLFKYLRGVTARQIARMLRIMTGFLVLHVGEGFVYIGVAMFGWVTLSPSVRVILISIRMLSLYTSMTLPYIIVQLCRTYTGSSAVTVKSSTSPSKKTSRVQLTLSTRKSEEAESSK